MKPKAKLKSMINKTEAIKAVQEAADLDLQLGLKAAIRQKNLRT